MENVQEMTLTAKAGKEGPSVVSITAEQTTLAVIFALSFSHMLNDMIQS